MSSLGTSGVGPGSANRFTAFRQGSIDGRNNSFRYPSPWWDVAHMDLPRSVKHLFRWCRYHMLVNPLVATTVRKMASYPITEVIIDDEPLDGFDKSKTRWEDLLFRVIDISRVQLEVGLDYHGFGNCVVSILYPFHKYLQCRMCGYKERIKRLKMKKDWDFKNWKYVLRCPKCGQTAPAKVSDESYKSYRDIKVIRWNPSDLDIDFNPITRQAEYLYTAPDKIRKKVARKNRKYLEELPAQLISAMKTKRPFVLSPENVFHFKAPTPSLDANDDGWGYPPILPALKDSFYLQIMKKAQEAVMLEHLVPLDILFPASQDANASPYQMVNLGDWKRRIEGEITKWRWDCVSPDSWVETQGGLVLARDVHVGHILRNKEGSWGAVVRRKERGLREGEKAYRIYARGLSAVETVLSEEHPLWVAPSTHKGNGHKLGEPRWVAIKDVKAGDYISYPTSRDIVLTPYLDLASYCDRAVTDDWVYVDHTTPEVPQAFELLSRGADGKSRKELCAENGWGVSQYKAAQEAIREGRELRRLPRRLENDAELAWVVGIYLAEGSTDAKSVAFALHEGETEYVERLEKFFSSRFGCGQHAAQRSEHGVQVFFSSTVASQLFKSLCPGTAGTKRIPQVYMEAEAPLVLSLLNGLISGDGCVHKTDGERKITYKSASIQLAEDVRKLMLSLEVPVGISKEEGRAVIIGGKETVSSASYKIQASGSSRRRLLAMFRGEEAPLEDVRMGVFGDGMFWHRVRGVEQVQIPTVIGFEVDNGHTFCTWGMVTHNCNYKPIMPIPLGHQRIGGDGRALMLTQEIRAWSEHIIAGMGVPTEFVFGGLSWSGSSVSLRMLENQLLTYRMMHEHFLQHFLVPAVARYMGWREVKMHMREFKMADDMQMKQMLMSLNQTSNVSSKTLLSEFGKDALDETKLLEQEMGRKLEMQKQQQMAQAQSAGEAQLIQTKFQIKAQEMMARAQQLQMQKQQGMQQQAAAQQQQASMQQQAQQAPKSVNVVDLAAAYAKKVSSMPFEQRGAILQRMQQSSPQLHDLVQQKMNEAQALTQEPLPEQRPPRRSDQVI